MKKKKIAIVSFNGREACYEYNRDDCADLENMPDEYRPCVSIAERRVIL
jgi:hypothetical protein